MPALGQVLILQSTSLRLVSPSVEAIWVLRLTLSAPVPARPAHRHVPVLPRCWRFRRWLDRVRLLAGLSRHAARMASSGVSPCCGSLRLRTELTDSSVCRCCRLCPSCSSPVCCPSPLGELGLCSTMRGGGSAYTRWLMIKGRNEEALHTLARLHARGNINDGVVVGEYTSIKTQLEEAGAMDQSWGQVRFASAVQWPRAAGLRRADTHDRSSGTLSTSARSSTVSSCSSRYR